MSAKIFFRNLGHFISFPFVAPSLLIGLSKSKKIYKKYYSDSEMVSEDERYEYVYKQTKKATFIANCDIEYEGIDKVPNVPVMYVCNHKAGFDPLLLLKIFSEQEGIVRPVFVSKVELLESKNVGNAAKLIDTIFIDRKNIRSAYHCIEQEKKVLAKRSVVVFIEGTRILSHEFGEFKSAALEPAFATMRPIVPVVIQGSLGVEQEDKSSFFKYKKINVKFMQPIKPNEFIHYSKEAIAERLKKSMYEEYSKFEKENPSKLYDKLVAKNKIKLVAESVENNTDNVEQKVEANNTIEEVKQVELTNTNVEKNNDVKTKVETKKPASKKTNTSKQTKKSSSSKTSSTKSNSKTSSVKKPSSTTKSTTTKKASESKPKTKSTSSKSTKSTTTKKAK